MAMTTTIATTTTTTIVINTHTTTKATSSQEAVRPTFQKYKQNPQKAQIKNKGATRECKCWLIPLKDIQESNDRNIHKCLNILIRKLETHKYTFDMDKVEHADWW